VGITFAIKAYQSLPQECDAQFFHKLTWRLTACLLGYAGATDYIPASIGQFATWYGMQAISTRVVIFMKL
jgi:hypothetical protein